MFYTIAIHGITNERIIGGVFNTLQKAEKFNDEWSKLLSNHYSFIIKNGIHEELYQISPKFTIF